MLMEIYMTPRGRTVFEHIDSVNDGRFTPSMFYYVSWVGLPSDYYTLGHDKVFHPFTDHAQALEALRDMVDQYLDVSGFDDEFFNSSFRQDLGGLTLVGVVQKVRDNYWDDEHDGAGIHKEQILVCNRLLAWLGRTDLCDPYESWSKLK